MEKNLFNIFSMRFNEPGDMEIRKSEHSVPKELANMLASHWSKQPEEDTSVNPSFSIITTPCEIDEFGFTIPMHNPDVIEAIYIDGVRFERS